MLATFYSFDPVPWPAGSIGDETIYHHCADCDAAGDMAGMHATEPSVAGICIVPVTHRGIPGHGLAVYCPACTARRLSNPPASH